MNRRTPLLGPVTGLVLCPLLLVGVARAQEEPEPEAEESEYEGVAEVEAPPREPTRHTLEKEELTTVPGTRGDALRAIEIMPGVARTQFGTSGGPPLLRGSPAQESLVLLDGAQVPLLYHFGGLTSFFNSHLLESVTLYPGNYSARYGRAAGGAVEAWVRAPKSDRLHLLLELSAIDSFALAEGPLGESTSIALAARRSNVDLFIDAVIDDDSTAVVAAPVYYDYQAILSHRFDEESELRAMLYGSSDAFELHFGEAANGDPGMHGEIGSRASFHRLQLSLESRLSPLVEQELMVSVGPSPGRGRLGEVFFDFVSWDVNARAEWSIFAAPWLRIDTGLDLVVLDTTFHYRGPTPMPSEGVPSQGSVASENLTDIESDIGAVRPAAFVEASLEPATGLVLIPGVRADYFSDVGAWTLDPRLAARFAAGPMSTLKAGIGAYSQPPEYWEVVEGFGNPNVKPYRTLQGSAGVEQAFGEHASADVDAFYKRWEDRVIGTPGGAPPRYVNGGSGDAYGLELLFDLRLAPKSQALLAYTLSRSTRTDSPNAPTRFFDRDQTHNLSLTANYDLGSGWLLGARFRYVTGSPYSPPLASVYDASTDTYRPLYGGVNEARHDAFHQLDLRVEKLWKVGPVDLTTYLEVMNVYNAKNQESRRYSFDYRESASVSGMPLFPNLGIRGAL